MIKPEWHFMLEKKTMKNKKQTTDHRLKRLENAVGELYIMIHHLNDAIILLNKKKDDV